MKLYYNCRVELKDNVGLNYRLLFKCSGGTWIKNVGEPNRFVIYNFF